MKVSAWYAANGWTVMKSLAVLLSCPLLLVVTAYAIPDDHAIPPNIRNLYDTVKHGGCRKFVDNSHSLNDGHGHTGTVLSLLHS